MTDQGGWRSPGGDRPGGGAEPPRYGERVPGWTPPPAAAAAQVPAPAGPVAYAPPPKRGLIPLHPLSFGQLLGGAFAVIRWNPRAAVVPALLVSVVQNALVLGLLGTIGISGADRLARASEADQGAIAAGLAAEGAIGGLFTVAVAVFLSALLQGMLVGVVADGALGVRRGFGAALRGAMRRVLPLVGFSVLLGLLQLVVLGVLVVLVVLFAQLGQAGVVVAVVTGVLGGVGFVVAYAFFAVKLATVPSAIVLERLGVFAAIRRSWVLLRGAFWRTFGLLALVVVMVTAAAQLISIPFSVLGGAGVGLLFPNAGQSDDVAAVLGPIIISTLPATIVGAVVSGIGQVATVSSVVLVYLDQRMRREGLDIELQRHVEGDGPNPLAG